jgi:hypothetical protein
MTQPFSMTVATALWQAWLEMNAIRARDGVPYQSYAGGGYGKACVDENYWSKCVDDLAAAYMELTGFEIMPWSPSTQFRSPQVTEGPAHD